MLLSAIRKHNTKGRLEDLSKLSGISLVHLYDINKHPEKKTLKLQTAEAIYTATYRLCGVGLTPDKYLIGVVMPFRTIEKKVNN